MKVSSQLLREMILKEMMGDEHIPIGDALQQALEAAVGIGYSAPDEVRKVLMLELEQLLREYEREFNRGNTR